jgi:hypothetical protein
MQAAAARRERKGRDEGRSERKPHGTESGMIQHPVNMEVFRGAAFAASGRPAAINGP